MKDLNHPNVVKLKHCFFTNGNEVRSRCFLQPFAWRTLCTITYHLRFCVRVGVSVAHVRDIRTRRRQRSRACPCVWCPHACPCLHLASRISRAGVVAQPDELYLNLVLEFIPETAYQVLRSYSRAKRPFPLLITKVCSPRVSPAACGVTVYSRASAWACMWAAVRVSALSLAGVHPLPGHLSSRHQAAEPAGEPAHSRAEAL
jgi:hypothetical protein